jgi:predicted GIY-YIG superfamily endonuclease
MDLNDDVSIVTEVKMSDFIKYEGDLSASYVGPEGPYLIYALVDPKDHTVRYVGQTTDLQTRFYAHCNQKENFREAAWISRLGNEGLRPAMVVLTKCKTQEDVDEREMAIIDEYLDKGCDLYNQRKNVRLHFGVSRRTYQELQKEMSLRKTTISNLIAMLLRASPRSTEGAGAAQGKEAPKPPSGVNADELLTQIAKMSNTTLDLVVKKDDLISFLREVREKDRVLSGFEKLMIAYDQLTDTYRHQVKKLMSSVESDMRRAV